MIKTFISFLIAFIFLSCTTKTPKVETDCVTETPIEESPTTSDSLVTINETNNYTIYFPHFSKIDLACNKMPRPEENDSIIFVCEAAFTGELLTSFQHSNIAGNHVSAGKLFKGYKCTANTGLFAYYNGYWTFTLHNYKDEIYAAHKNGGMAFGQNMIIYNKQVQKEFRSNNNIYRALCELNNKLCIIESKKNIPYSRFIQLLQQIDVTHALYLDMGPGWNYAWLRPTENSIIKLHKETSHYTTNWITFYK